MAHRSLDRDDRKVSTVAFDYMFVTRGDVYTRDEFDEAANGDQWLKILVAGFEVGFELRTWRASQVAGRQGLHRAMVADDVAWLGYSRVILKSDNEPAIVAVLREFTLMALLIRLWRCTRRRTILRQMNWLNRP